MTPWNEVRDTFRRVWGYDDFRPPQGDVIECLVAGRDALIVMPTGGGKSICFQLPALLKQGLTLVISPLVALMENQVQELQEKRLPAGLLHSQLPKQVHRQTLWSVDNQRLRLLYLSPETLFSPAVWSRLCQPHIQINGLVLDEAHCLVQWGDTFRPAYRRLGTVRPALLRHKPPGSPMAIAAFTATADPKAQNVLRRVLQLENPKEILLSPYRPNLDLSVRITWSPRCRRAQLLRFIRPRFQESGLVYVRQRRSGEALAHWLAQQGFVTTVYHGGLSASERRRIEGDWLDNRLPFVVTTSAFGMGINKPDCRWVVHLQAPLLLSEYIQEVGRAGRDRQSAVALALVSEPTGWLDPTERQNRQFFLEQGQKDYRHALSLLGKLPTSGEIRATVEEFPGSAIALSLLHSAGQLQWRDPFHYVIVAKGGSIQNPSQQQEAAAQAMMRFLYTRTCRWRQLLEAFGFATETVTWRCGHCDNCRR